MKYICLLMVFCGITILAGQSRKIPLDVQSFSGCFADRGIYKMHKSLPSQIRNKNLVIEAENAISLFFQEDVFARKSGGKADQLLQIKQSAAEYGPQNDETASNRGYIDYCSLAAYQFNLENAGNYTLWFRVWVPMAANWNFDVLVDNVRHHVVLTGKIPAPQTWFWLKGPEVKFTKGNHQLQIANLLNGKRLDQFVLSQDTAFDNDQGKISATPEQEIDTASIVFKPILPIGLKRWGKILFRNTGGGEVAVSVSSDGGSSFEKISDLDLGRFSAAIPLTIKLEMARAQAKTPEIKELRVDYQIDEQAFVVLKNPGLELLFSRENGALSGIVNPVTGSRYQPALQSENMFELLVKAPGERERRYLQFKNSRLVRCDIRNDRELTLHWKFDEEPVEVMFVLKSSRDLIDWEVRVINNSPTFDIIEVEAPRISRLRISDNPEDDTLVWPFSAGEFIPYPAARGTQTVAYPDHAGLPYVDLYNQREGLYFAVHDPLLVATHFFSRGNYEQNAIELSINRRHRIRSKSTQSYRFAIAGHVGGWHEGAKIYREYFYSQYPLNRYVPWLRDADAWLAGSNTGHSGLMRKRENYRAMMEDFKYAAFLSLPYIQSWGSTFNGACPSYYLPRADKGGEEMFSEMIKFWRQYGQIGFYFHGNAVSPYYLLTDKYFTVPWEQYPPEHRPPSWEWYIRNKEYASDNADIDKDRLLKQTAELNAAHATGKIIRGNAEESMTGYMPMSWHGNAFPDYLRKWLDIYIKRYHCNTVYLDTFAFRNKLADFNPHLNLNGEGDKPMFKMRWMKELFEDMQAAEPEFAALTEGVGDVFGTRLYFLLSGFARNPEIFRYTLPDQIFFQGTCNGLWTPPLAEKSLTQAFLVGNRFDLSVVFSQGYHALRLRQRISPFLNLAVFDDKIGLLCDNPGIEAYVHLMLPLTNRFVENHGTRAATITFSNQTGEPGTMRYKLPDGFVPGRAFIAKIHHYPHVLPFTLDKDTVVFEIPASDLGAVLLIDSASGPHCWTAMLQQTAIDRFEINLFNFLDKNVDFIIDADGQNITATVDAGQHHAVEITRRNKSTDFEVIPVRISSSGHVRDLIISQGNINRTIPRPAKSTISRVDIQPPTAAKTVVEETILEMDFEQEKYDLHNSYMGKRSFKLSGNGKYQAHKFPLQLEPDTTYKITLAISKGFGVSKVGYHNCVAVANYCEDNKLQRYVLLGDNIPGDNKWHLLTGEFTTDKNLHNCGFYVYNRDSHDDVWIDEVRITKVK